MEQCPKCKNEELKEDYKYCPICGVNLKKSKREEVILDLKHLIDRNTSLYEYERASIKHAIKELKRIHKD